MEGMLRLEIGSYGKLGSGGREGNDKPNHSETICASECQMTLWAGGSNSIMRQVQASNSSQHDFTKWVKKLGPELSAPHFPQPS